MTALGFAVRLTVVLGGAFLWFALAAAAWGGWTGFLANPARRATVAAGFAISAFGVFAPFNISPGKRTDTRDLWIFVPAILLIPFIVWLPPYLDRRDRWVIDGDAVRWLGLVLYTAGGLLRVWPMFVLGRRFSGLVAIQQGHRLVTGGPYRVIRHPSYLGLLVNHVGWSLVFRSVVGLLVLLPLTWLLVARIRSEEALLASEFGADYDAYRRRTWRLVPLGW